MYDIRDHFSGDSAIFKSLPIVASPSEPSNPVTDQVWIKTSGTVGKMFFHDNDNYLELVTGDVLFITTNKQRVLKQTIEKSGRVYPFNSAVVPEGSLASTQLVETDYMYIFADLGSVKQKKADGSYDVLEAFQWDGSVWKQHSYNSMHYMLDTTNHQVVVYDAQLLHHIDMPLGISMASIERPAYNPLTKKFYFMNDSTTSVLEFDINTGVSASLPVVEARDRATAVTRDGNYYISTYNSVVIKTRLDGTSNTRNGVSTDNGSVSRFYHARVDSARNRLWVAGYDASSRCAYGPLDLTTLKPLASDGFLSDSTMEYVGLDMDKNGDAYIYYYSYLKKLSSDATSTIWYIVPNSGNYGMECAVDLDYVYAFSYSGSYAYLTKVDASNGDIVLNVDGYAVASDTRLNSMWVGREHLFVIPTNRDRVVIVNKNTLEVEQTIFGSGVTYFGDDTGPLGEFPDSW